MTDASGGTRPPFPKPPGPGETLEVAAGLLWMRLPLPLRLDHVNVYLVLDGEAWTLIDTGPGSAETMAIWSTLLDAGPEGPLQGLPITRIVATHHHPDHVGAACFLAERCGVALLMNEVEYLTALLVVKGADGYGSAWMTEEWRRNGLDDQQRATLMLHADRYRELVPDLPQTFEPLRPGDRLAIGPRVFDVMALPGHSPAQLVLHEPTENLLVAADQVMTRLSPNISIADRSPGDDPLGRYLDSLAQLRATVPDGGLVLPGHHLPFRHLHARTAELEAHHAERCTSIEHAVASKGLTAADLVSVLFRDPLDRHELWFAFSETLAHLSYLARRGRIEARLSHGRRRWGSVGRASHPA